MFLFANHPQSVAWSTHGWRACTLVLSVSRKPLIRPYFWGFVRGGGRFTIAIHFFPNHCFLASIVAALGCPDEAHKIQRLLGDIGLQEHRKPLSWKKYSKNHPQHSKTTLAASRLTTNICTESFEYPFSPKTTPKKDNGSMFAVLSSMSCICLKPLSLVPFMEVRSLTVPSKEFSKSQSLKEQKKIINRILRRI